MRGRICDGRGKAPPIGARRNRKVLLETETHGVGNSPVDVHDVQPRSRAVAPRGDVEQRVRVQKRRVGHFRVVIRQALGRAAARRDPPDVHVVRGREPAGDVDEAAVGGPNREVVGDARVADEDLLLVGAVSVGHEHVLTNIGRVIDEPRTVRRPCDRDGAIQERTRIPAESRNEPRGRSGPGPARAGQTDPDVRVVPVKPDVAPSVAPGNGDQAMGEIADLVASHLHDPGVDRASMVGNERDELAAARDRRVELGSFPVRQPRESGAGERVPPEIVALTKPPSHDSESQQNRRGDRPQNPPAP